MSKQPDAIILPEWVPAPKVGCAEHYSGLTRYYLYKLANARLIHSVTVKAEPHQLTGRRLFYLPSILAYLKQQHKEQLESGEVYHVRKHAIVKKDGEIEDPLGEPETEGPDGAGAAEALNAGQNGADSDHGAHQDAEAG